MKGATKSEDKDLSELVVKYRSGWVLDGDFTSRLSTLQFKVGHIRGSVEATVFMTVTAGSWPEGFRGVFSAGTNGNGDLQVKILDTGDDPLPVDANGAIKLTRRVVSVELAEKLKVSVVAYPVSKEQAVESSQAILMPERDGESVTHLSYVRSDVPSRLVAKSPDLSFKIRHGNEKGRVGSGPSDYVHKITGFAQIHNERS